MAFQQHFQRTVFQILFSWVLSVYRSRILSNCPRIFPSPYMLNKSRPFVHHHSIDHYFNNSVKKYYNDIQCVCEHISQLPEITPEVVFTADSFSEHWKWLQEVLKADLNMTTFIPVSSGTDDDVFLPQGPVLLSAYDPLDAILAHIAADVGLMVPWSDSEWNFSFAGKTWVVSVWEPRVIPPLLDRVPNFFVLDISDLLNCKGTVLELLYNEEELFVFEQFIAFLSNYKKSLLRYFCTLLNACLAEKYVFDMVELVPCLFVSPVLISQFLNQVHQALTVYSSPLALVLNRFFLKCRAAMLEQLFSSQFAFHLSYWLASCKEFKCKVQWARDPSTAVTSILKMVKNVEIPITAETSTVNGGCLWVPLESFLSCYHSSVDEKWSVCPSPSLVFEVGQPLMEKD
ncbi:hypothetical protein GEMRC1_002010 [Eukaryota sp. GEM-RC1]